MINVNTDDCKNRVEITHTKRIAYNVDSKIIYACNHPESNEIFCFPEKCPLINKEKELTQ